MKTTLAWSFLVLCSLGMLASGNVWAGALDEIQKRGTLRVGMEPGYMPFEFTNQLDEIIGFDVDMANHMAEAMGVKLELVSTAWEEIIPALLAKKFDIIVSGMTLTQERNLRVNFAEPYIVVGQTILIRKELADRVQSYQDLDNPRYTVVSKLGTPGEVAVKQFMPKATHLFFETEQEGVMEVLEGKADAFIYSSPYNAVANARYGKDKLVFLDRPFTYEPLAWAVRKGDYDFINWLNHFLSQIRKDGTYERIYHTWFRDDSWLEE